MHKMLPPNAALLAVIVVTCGLSSPVEANTPNDFVFWRDCTTKNLDATTTKNSDDPTAANTGMACIQYIKAFLDGFGVGSLEAENYLTGYISDQAAKIYPADSDYKQALSPMQQAIVSSKRRTPYDLCIPKGTSDLQIARIVVNHLEAEKPELRRYERPDSAIPSALIEKFQNADLSCKSGS